ERLGRHRNTRLFSRQPCRPAVQLQSFRPESPLFEQGREEARAAAGVPGPATRAQPGCNPVDVRLELGTERRARVLHREQLFVVAVSVKANDVIQCRMWVCVVLLAGVATGKMPLAGGSAAEDAYGR